MNRPDLVNVNFRLTDPKTMRGHHGSALSHIKSGVNILNEVEYNSEGKQNHLTLMTSLHPFVDFRELEVLFNRLDSQAVQVTTPFSSVLSWPSFPLSTLTSEPFNQC